MGELSDIFETASQLFRGSGKGGGAKFGLSHGIQYWLLTLRTL